MKKHEEANLAVLSGMEEKSQSKNAIRSNICYMLLNICYMLLNICYMLLTTGWFVHVYCLVCYIKLTQENKEKTKISMKI